MRARFRSAAVFAAVLTTLVAVAPTAAAEDPIGGPLLAGSEVVIEGHPGTPRPPSVDAASYVLADLDTGAILAAKAAHRRLRPASTLKMLTALALMPRLDLDDTYTATYEDDVQIGSAVGIVEGSTYTIDELFVGLFLASGNDAAHALANAAGGLPATVRLMREEAERIQALDTTPMNASGLDAAGQLSSAYDLALIGRAGMQIEEFREYAATEHAQFPDAQRDETYEIGNHNQLLSTYPGAIGVKNGYTSKAGYTFVGAAERGGRSLIVALMEGRSDVQQEAASLMDWGFEYGDEVDPVGVLVEPIPDEPDAPPPTPTAGAANPESGGSGDAAGFPVSRNLALSVTIVVMGLLAGGAGTVLAVRRYRRRHALRAELVRWATTPRPRPATGYAPLNGHPASPPAGTAPVVRSLPPLAIPAGSHATKERADMSPQRRAPAPQPPMRAPHTSPPALPREQPPPRALPPGPPRPAPVQQNRPRPPAVQPDRPRPPAVQPGQPRPPAVQPDRPRPPASPNQPSPGRLPGSVSPPPAMPRPTDRQHAPQPPPPPSPAPPPPAGSGAAAPPPQQPRRPQASRGRQDRQGQPRQPDNRRNGEPPSRYR